jgi:RNA polymerase sigma-70 factor (ECF subfamily)
MSQFYQAYHAPLYAVAFRIIRNRQSAEDVVQESMVKVWLAIATYDPEQARLLTWAAKVCANVAIDYVRTARYRLTRRSTSLEDTVAGRLPGLGGFQPEHIGMPELLRALRPEYRQLLDLIYLQGYTQQEAALHLAVPLGTVKTWSTQARRQLLRWIQLKHP